MLKKVKRLAFEKDYTYAPLQEDAVVNTDHIVQVYPTDGRGVGPFVHLDLAGGESMVCVGNPGDFLPDPPSVDERRRKPVPPYDCKHPHTLFIQGGRSGPDPAVRENVSVCRDCGTFFVRKTVDGKRIQVSFNLPTQELVDAAGQFARLLQQEEQKNARG